MVKIVISNIKSRIVGYLPDEVQHELSDALSYEVMGAKHMPKVKSGQWDGYIRLYEKSRGQNFFTGLLSYVRGILDKHNIEYEKIDRRDRPAQNYPELEFNPPSSYEERDYQTLTIDRAQQFTRGILEVCTGGGKTMIVTKLIGEIKIYPFVFYVLTKDLMDQAHNTLSRCLNQPIGKIGDGHCDIQKISVCTIQTAILALHSDQKKLKLNTYQFDDDDKWDEKGIENIEKAEWIRRYLSSLKGMYFDECHHSAALTCKEIMMASPDAYWRFGGSATPYRESGDSIMIQALFGAKIVNINASYLINRKYLLKPYIFFVPYENKTDAKTYKKIYSECIVKNRDFNTHIAETANFLVSRGLTCLILVREYSQGEYIKTLIPNCEFVTGKMSTKQRKQAIEDLRQRKTMCMIATTLADEGLDIPTLDTAILASGGASATRVNQRIGRTIRPDLASENPPDKSIVICYDHYKTKYLKDHANKTRSILRMEPEFEVKNSRGVDFIKDEIDNLLGVQTHSNDLFSM